MTAVLMTMALFWSVGVQAAPSFSLTANGTTKLFANTGTVVALRAAVNVDTYAGKTGRVFIRVVDPRKGMSPVVSYYTKNVGSLAGGVWAGGAYDVYSGPLKSMAAATIFSGKLPEGTYLYDCRVYAGTTLVARAMTTVYVYATDPLRLLSSQILPDKRHYYKFRLLKKYFEKNGAPFIMGDFNAWKPQALKDLDGDGNYEFTITSFNDASAFTFGGDYAGNDWGKIWFSQFFDPARELMVMNLVDGMIHRPGIVNPSLPAGTDPIIRFEAYANGKLPVWVNLKKVNGSVSKPFWMSNLNNWAKASFNTVITSGWARVYLTVPANCSFRLAYGGDSTIPTWSDPTSSAYWDTATKSLVVVMINGVPKHK
jgi:hypothetical protein